MHSLLVLFGATGDLSLRYLLPAAARLLQDDLLPDNFRIVGVSRKDHPTEEFRRIAAEALADEPDLTPAAVAALLQSLSHVRADVTEARQVAEALGNTNEPAVAYLALPTHVYPAAIDTVANTFPPGSSIALEKPFGEDLASAEQLNRQLGTHFPEEAIFRIDHFLGLSAVQALPGLRFGNAPLEQSWDRRHIERIEITWDEHLALEGRAGYYDRAGALRDMVQNHLLEVMSAVAQEHPASMDAEALRKARLHLFQEVRRFHAADVPRRVVRARYSGGRIDGVDIPAYAEEQGVDQARQTETFAQMVLYVDNERWQGVPFVLRTGKALGEERREVAVRFRPGSLPRLAGAEAVPPTSLHVDLLVPRLRLASATTTGHSLQQLAPVTLIGDLPRGLPAYARVLLNILEGDQSLFVGETEAEELWRIVDPVLKVWEHGDAPLLEYAAGSEGPALGALHLD